MKKLLLSSIIMFGICGFVTAQNATGSKLAKKHAAETKAAAPAATPQKAAVAPSDDMAPANASAVKAATDIPADMQDAKAKQAGVKPATPAVDNLTTVNAAGEVVPDNAKMNAAKIAERKAAAVKAANAKKDN